MNENIFEKIPDMHYREEAPEIDYSEFKAVLESRRSVRVYTEDIVPVHVVEEALDAALLAPSSSNLQCWEFYWIADPPRKVQLAEACFNQPAARTANVLIVCVARTKTWKKVRQQMLDYFKTQPEVPKAAVEYYRKLVPFVYSQGFLGIYGFLKWLVFSVAGFFRPVPRGPFGEHGMQLWAVKSCALACENIMLSFRAQGYDSCPMEGFDEVRVKDLLQLPNDAIVTMVVSAGKRAPNGVYGPRIRFNRDQFVKRI
jgi:nitroreductase